MIEILVGAFVIIAAYGYYTFIYQPTQQMKKYEKLLTNLGYNVKVFPLKPFGSSLLSYYQGQEKLHGDQYY